MAKPAQSTPIKTLDLAVLAAELSLKLINGTTSDFVDLAAETAAAVEQSLPNTTAGAQARFALCAIESALAGVGSDPTTRAWHRRRALQFLREGGGLDLLPEPVVNWEGVIDEHIAVVLGALHLSILAGPVGRLRPRQEVARDLQGLRDVADSSVATDLLTAVRVVARQLAIPLQQRRKPSVPPLPDEPPWTIAAMMFSEGRPDVLASPLRRAVTREVARLARAGVDPLRVANLLEALAVADAWPLLAAGPEQGWGRVRNHVAFDSYLHRAALIGSSQTNRSMTWRVLESEVDTAPEVWMREVQPDLTKIIVAGHDGSRWFSIVVELDDHHARALAALCSAQPGRVTFSDRHFLGSALLAPLREALLSNERTLIRAILSPVLRTLPMESLVIDDEMIIDRALIIVAPSLNCHEIEPDEPVGREGESFQVIGMLDESLQGVRDEVATLRDLVRSGEADGIAFSGSDGLRRHLVSSETWDLLTIGVHGSMVADIPVLYAPAGDVTVPDMLEWQLPPFVSLACCRSAETGPERAPMDLVTACLRRGARTVVAARWSISDRALRDIVASLHTAMILRRIPMSVALREAMLEARNINDAVWYWAGLGGFGSF